MLVVWDDGLVVVELWMGRMEMGIFTTGIKHV